MLDVRSFVDVGAFAGATVVEPGRGEADWTSSRVLLDRALDPVTVAVAAFDEAHGRVGSLGADEHVIVTMGALTIASSAGTSRVTPGNSIMLPAGCSFDFQAAASTKLIITAYGAPPAPGQLPIAIDLDAPLSPSNPPKLDLLIGDVPDCRSNNQYLSADGEYMVGTWDSTPYHRVSMTYGHTEVMHILEGEVTFVDGADRVCVARTGDIVLVERGADCSWLSTVHVKKVYAIYRPK